MLQARSDAQFSIVQSGSVKSVSANEQHVAFGEKGNGQEVTPQEVLSVWQYLIELFYRATDDLQVTIPTPTDAQVESQMRQYLRPVYGYTSNWMYLAK